jgi:hypothetical protein
VSCSTWTQPRCSANARSCLVKVLYFASVGWAMPRSRHLARKASVASEMVADSNASFFVALVVTVSLRAAFQRPSVSHSAATSRASSHSHLPVVRRLNFHEGCRKGRWGIRNASTPFSVRRIRWFAAPRNGFLCSRGGGGGRGRACPDCPILPDETGERHQAIENTVVPEVGVEPTYPVKDAGF